MTAAAATNPPPGTSTGTTALGGTAAAPPNGATGPETPVAAPPAAEVKGTTEVAAAVPPPAALELKLPEGFAADEAVLGKFKAAAAELGLKSEGAQKLFDLYAGTVQQQQQALEQQQQGWKDAAAKDKEIGGAASEKSLAEARKALTKFGTPELQALLSDNAVGDHPEVIRLLARVGKALGEDSVSSLTGAGNAGAGKPMDDAALATAMYPKMLAKQS